MNQVEELIEQLLDRRAKYGGTKYLIHVRRIVNHVIRELDLEPTFSIKQKVIHKVIDALEIKGAKFWGFGYRKSVKTGKTYSSRVNRIYSISR
jgi:hypothetical protein